MALTTAQYSTAFAALLAQFEAGDISEAEFAAAHLALLQDWPITSDDLVAQVVELVTSLDASVVEGPPAASLGRLNSIAIDLDAQLLYGPKTLAGWGDPRPLSGADGEDGREVSMQKSATHIQWRLGDGAWANLVALTELKGDTGTAATIAVAGVTTGEPGSEAAVENTGTASAAELVFTIPRGDKGEPGDALALQVNATHIQWKVGEGAWADLVALETLAGADAEDLSLQVNETHIQWRLGEGAWSDLIALSALVGAQGDAGWSPVLAVEIDGDRRVLRVVGWVGGEGDAPGIGQYVGAAGLVTDIADAVDIRGGQGDQGYDGWTPVLAVATDGARRVHQVVDWVGGEYAKPPVGLYVGATDLVATIADAVDIRGSVGAQGEKAWSPVFSAAADGSRRVLRVTGWIGGEGDAPATGQYVGAAGYVAEIADALDIRGLPGTGFVPMGEWAIGTTYVTGDAVSLSGKSYASMVDGNIGIEPGVTADWDDSWMVIADPAAAIGISDIAGLQAALDAKADKADTYTKAQVDAALALKLDNSAGPLIFQNFWNAATNTPTIPAAASGNKGHLYIVTTAGATNIDGETDWKVKDWIVSNGTAWTKIDNTEPDVDAAIDARIGTTEGKLLALGAGGKVDSARLPDGFGGASWALVDADGTMTDKQFEIVSGATATRTRNLPSPLVVGQQYAIKAIGGSARMGANGNTIRHKGVDIGGDLLMADGETAYVVADSTSTVEIM